jgi:hypothetical protein
MSAPNIAVLDLETDPFEFGVVVQPFLSGFYDGKRLITHWSDDCIKQLVDSLEKESTKWCIYAHNGGRFDFFYFLDYLQRGDMRIINGRIVQARIGSHELRDSFAIMPFPLADYDKDTIDYNKMRRDRRETHRDEIQAYFKNDLTALYDLVTAFHAEFGDKLTIGSASMSELKKRSKFDCGSGEYDAKFRKDFYFGGRNQVFKGGIIDGDIRVYDVNSMYPFAMSSDLHPVGTIHAVSKRIEANSVFVVAEGHNYGAFPQRCKDNSLDFTVPYGTFSTTIHEWRAALETNSFKPTKIIKSYTWRDRATFEEFVNHFYDAKSKAKEQGDKIRELFYKYCLNSAYGKFAQNPDNYFDWFITSYGEYPDTWHECTKSCNEPCEKKWEPAYIFELKYIIWRRPLERKLWYNIATGASITGAARAILLKGICATKEPLYCDTDSIICRGASLVQVHDTRLGFWDLEASGSVAAICGKKLYAILDSDVERVKAKFEKKKKTPEILDTSFGTVAVVKKAHKGARLTGAEILRIAQGETITAENPVPSFKWDGTATFTKRRLKRTA